VLFAADLPRRLYARVATYRFAAASASARFVQAVSWVMAGGVFAGCSAPAGAVDHDI